MNNCLCGDNKGTIGSRNGFRVTSKGELSKCKIATVECQSCGLIRQINLPFKSQKGFDKYYKNYPPVSSDYCKKDYGHDITLAQKRYRAYKLSQGNLLDVGCGSGAFVDECRTQDREAYGCEIAKYADIKTDQYIYHDAFENIHFPTDNFDYITCHDVLEHIFDLVAFMDELFRVTKQDGYCIVEIPDFFSDDGTHHWKEFEHIWFLNRKNLIDLAKKSGFEFEKTNNPIPGKIVIWFKKPKQHRTKILVPPGIGDSYWSLVKMQSFLEKENLSLPDIYIAAGYNRKYSGHVRSVPFLKMFPFINITGDYLPLKKLTKGQELWNEAYAEKGRTVFKDILGYDYLISYNGHIRWGAPLEQIDPQYKCNWHPPMFVSLEQERYKKECIAKYGKYVCFYLPFYGHYKHWTGEFSIENIIKTINRLANECKITPVLLGAQWDADDKPLTNTKKEIKNLVDLTGKTSTEQVFGCMKGSQLVFGFPSGLTIMAAGFGCKTLLAWNDYFELGIKGNKFFRYSCPPDVWGKNYFAMNTATMSVDNVVSAARNILNDKQPETFWPKEVKGKPQAKTKTLEKAPTGMKDKHPVLNKIDAPTVSLSKNRELDKKEKIVITCVLENNGVFDVSHVRKLRNMVKRHTTIPHVFLCITDVDIPKDICNSHQLKTINRGWGKPLLFEYGLISATRIINFDLNIVITANIDDILLANASFLALKPWNHRIFKEGLCSLGIMSWENGGTYSFIYDKLKLAEVNNYPRGDQSYISKMLTVEKKKPVFLQEEFPGIYSYKNHCRRGLPEDARIVCFHGKPRLADVKASWVRKHWA